MDEPSTGVLTFVKGLRGLLPVPSDYRELRTSWRVDLLSGVTVGIVALPLALAFGASSGAGAEAGLITAIIGGLVATIFGGSNVQVSGPTGAMVVVLAPVIATYGPSVLGLLGIMAGIIVCVCGLFRFGRLVGMIPWPVIEGFTLGIGVIIFMQQVPAALGVADKAGMSSNALVSAVQSFGRTDWSTAKWTLLVAAIVAACMLVGARFNTKVPWSLIGLVAATLVCVFANLPVASIGELPAGLPAPAFPHLSLSLLSDLSAPALTVALLAAIESLLSARVAASHSDTGVLQADRELFGQGLASIASGLFGGMPATGAIARTAVNMSSGARTRAAAIVHAIVLFVIVISLGDIVAKVPLAALAGVLMVTALRMIHLDLVKRLLTLSKQDALMFIATAVVTVSVDLIYAVIAGVVIATFLLLRMVSKAAGVHRVPLPEPAEPNDNRIARFKLEGSLFFAAAERLLQRIEDTRDVSVVIISMSRVRILDSTGATLLGELITAMEGRGVTVLIEGLQDRHILMAERTGVTEAVSSSANMAPDKAKAIELARRIVAWADVEVPE
ncbi:MAG: SulP family inorganic anion transporter [Propionibacteriaceae bacterium]|nr:SulP family inorganic anion transporter [Propionibacteriaceae bacterium]